MINRPKKKVTSPEKTDQDVASAGKLWREKFNASKLAVGQTKGRGTHQGISGVNMPNRFKNTTRGNISQKTRKGSRPK